MKKGEGIASRKDRKKKRRDLAAYLLADIQRELAHSHSDDKASCIQALLAAEHAWLERTIAQLQTRARTCGEMQRSLHGGKETKDKDDNV